MQVGIIGLGYVGIPLARRISQCGQGVTGFDIDAERVSGLNGGRSPIKHIADAEIGTMLGDGFEAIEIDSGPGNEHGFTRAAHSVLTLEVREVDGHPAYEARKRVVAFLNERLR